MRSHSLRADSEKSCADGVLISRRRTEIPATKHQDSMRQGLHSRNWIPIPQLKVKAKLGRFIAAMFSQSFYHMRCRRLSLPPRICNSF